MASFSGKVTGGTLALRQGTSSGSTRLNSIPNGTALTVSTISGNYEWFSTSYGGQTGFVLARWIAITSGGTPAKITTQTDPLNIRATPPSGAVSFEAPKGSTVRILDLNTTSGFYRISCSLGTGWGSAAYIKHLYLSPFQGYPKQYLVPVYQGPDFNSGLIGYVDPPVQNVYQVDQSDFNYPSPAWISLDAGVNICYAEARFLRIDSNNTIHPTVTTKSSLTLYSSYLSNRINLGIPVSSGDSVVLLDAITSNDWCRIATNLGTGWVSTSGVNLP